MSYIDKVVGIAGMGSAVANVSLLKRFLAGVTVVIALTAISGTMAGMILIVGFYGLYVGLMHYGLQPQAAAFAVSGLAVIITAGLGGMAVIRWRQLSDMPNLMQGAPLAGHIARLAEAFLDGLLPERDGHNR